jgi:putative S-layer protein/internalin A-like/N-acetylmuramoyl-L-alanine amidase
LKGEKMESVKRLSSKLLVIVLTMAMLMTSMALPMNSHADTLYPKMTVKVVDESGATVENPKLEVSYLDESYDDLAEETVTEIVKVTPDASGKYKLYVNRKTTVKVSKDGYEPKTEKFTPDGKQEEFEKVITLKKNAEVTPPPAPVDKLTPIVNKFKAEYRALSAKYGVTNNAADLAIEKMKSYTDLDSEGVTVKVISSNKESVIASDGTINFVKKEKTAAYGINHENVSCTFEFSYNGEKKTVSRTVMVGWDAPHLNKKVKAISDGITFDTIKGSNTAENNIVSDLTLPQIDGTSVSTAWSNTKWESSNPDVLSVQDANQYAGLNTPKKAVVKQPKQDTVVTLTAKTGVNSGILNSNIEKPGDFDTITKQFTLTVKGSGKTGPTAEELQALLDKYITPDLLKYVSKEDGEFDPNHVIGNILLPRYTKIKGDDNKLVFENKEITYSTDDDAIKVNGYAANVDRFQAGEKTVNLIVTFKRDDVTVTKKIPLKIAVITDAELDAEIKEMEYAKEHFFDGINDRANASKDSVKEDLHAFYEFHFDGENPVWVYTMGEKTGRGIVPVSYFKSSVEAETNGYDTFKSSNKSVITHQNLLVTRQAQDTKVTVSAWLSSAKYGDLAKKYPNNAKLQKLSKQEVSVELTVLGERSNNKEVLNAKINEAKNLVAEISEGDKASEYAKGTKVKLQKAIADAEAVSSDASADADKIQAAIKALEAAMKEANDAQNPIAISAIVQNESNAYTKVLDGLKVSPKEAAEHGYFKAEAFADKATVLDALVAIHHEMYGADFDAHPENYLVVPENGFITKIFGVTTGDLGYYVNNQYPVDETGMGTVANTTVLKNGDVLNIYRYFNQDYKAIYMSFDQKKVEARTAQEFTLSLKGEKTLADWSKKKDAYAGAKVAVKDAEGNVVAEAVTDKDGIAKLTVEKAGKYSATVTALADDETASKQFIAPYAEVNIKPAAPSIKIFALAQADRNAYTKAYMELEVSPYEAEKYGYTKAPDYADKVTILDAMVAIHRDMYGANFEADPMKYLEAAPNGWILAMFGEKTSDVGYFINNRSTTTLSSDSVLENGDRLNIFKYFDKDYYALFMSFDKVKLEAETDKEFTLKLNGMSTFVPPSEEGEPYEGGKVVLKDENNKVVAETKTGKDGLAKFKVSKPGKYVAVMESLAEGDTHSFFIAPYAEITVKGEEKPVVKEEDVRVQGADRYDTAYKNADALKKQLGLDMFDSAVVACGSNYPDALSAAYLAKVKNAPLLLSDVGEVQGTVDYIRKNVAKGKTVYLIGGRRVLPEEIKTILGSDYDVKRIEGADRFLTNLAVLKEANVNNEEIMVCSGLGFADAISAAATGRPVLLVDDVLTAEQKDFLGGINPAKFYIVGGKKSVSDNVQTALTAMRSTERIAGTDRFDTAVQVAKKFFDMKSSTVVIANGNGFADGIVAGVTAMANNAPLLLVDDSNLKGAADFVKETGAKRSIVMGGARAVSNQAVKVLMGR